MTADFGLGDQSSAGTGPRNYPDSLHFLSLKHDRIPAFSLFPKMESIYP